MGSALLPSPSWPVDAVSDESFEDDDACSICLEPFTSLDPPSVTKCKHEYHLHCILEWSQRRNECPVCAQHLVLKDPVSQELLEGVEGSKNLRLTSKFTPVNQNNNNNDDAAYVDEPDFEQRIMLHFKSIANRARNISRRRSPSPIIPYVPNTNMHSPISPSQSQPDSPGRSSESVAFSESLKSKISTASLRYKESISKSTHSLKEKLVAPNNSVKEFSRGLSRMIGRLEIHQKRGGVSTPLSSCSKATSNSLNEEIKD